MLRKKYISDVSGDLKKDSAKYFLAPLTEYNMAKLFS